MRVLIFGSETLMETHVWERHPVAMLTWVSHQLDCFSGCGYMQQTTQCLRGATKGNERRNANDVFVDAQRQRPLARSARVVTDKTVYHRALVEPPAPTVDLAEVPGVLLDGSRPHLRDLRPDGFVTTRGKAEVAPCGGLELRK